MAGRIFVSYRRRDTSGYAHLVYTLLRKEFGAENVFMDVDTIEPGQDFVEALDKALSICDVLIVLIGPMWLNIQDESGARRLDDPKDFVRLEITSAINHKKKIIPVLFDGVTMPGQAELPSDIRLLARRQAVRIGERAADDIQRLLIKAIKQAIQDYQRQDRGEPFSLRRWLASKFLRGRAALFSLIIGAFLLSTIVLAVIFGPEIFGRPDPPNPTEEVTAGAEQTPTSPSGTATGQDTVLQWRIDGDRAVLTLEQEYWEKYTADTSPAGLYLRSDTVDVFGDFLELNSDGTFTLEKSGTVQTGTWTIDGDKLTLIFP